MNKIQGITDNGNQVFTLLLPGGGTCSINLFYKPLQIGWYVAVKYQSFAVNVIRVGASLNLLDQFSNLIPFGLACFTTQGQDPFFQQDFQSGNATLCLLDSNDLLILGSYFGSKV